MKVRVLVLAFACLFASAALDSFVADDGVALADARGRRRPHRRGTHRRRARPRPAPVRATVSASYRRMRDAWHAAPPVALRRAWLAKRPRPLVLRPVGSSRSYTLVPDARGKFGDEALATAREAFRYGSHGAVHEVEPRLLELCHRAVLRFQVPYVTLVSGYRERKATSRHDQGRAMDIVLPGVSNERLAAFLRPQGFVGIGVYPASGFVHLDVRARSYFWIDRSGPNDPSRTEATNGALISRFDTAARRRGERPVADVVASASESDEAPSENAAESADEDGALSTTARDESPDVKTDESVAPADAGTPN